MNKTTYSGNQADRVKRHLLRLLRQANEASQRCKKLKDRTALHDFRVALRRLSTWLGACGVAFGIEKRHYRKLRHLVRRTNDVRDHEVEIAWLVAYRKNIDHAHRAILQREISRRRRAYRKELIAVREQISQEWPKRSRSLRQRIKTPHGDSFDIQLRDCVQPAVDALANALDEVTSLRNSTALHHARVRVKKLRYLLELFAKSDDVIRRYVDDLTAMQDCLGTSNDLSLLIKHYSRPLAPPGIAATELGINAMRRALIAVARVERKHCHRTIKSAYLGKAAPSLLIELRGL